MRAEIGPPCGTNAPVLEEERWAFFFIFKTMILKRGDRNTNVAAWQNFLARQGFKDVKPDGDFGPATELATKAFQRMAVLREDGIVGDNTIAQARQRGFDGFDGSAVVGVKPIETKGADKLDKVHPSLAKKVAALINMAAAEGFTLRVTQGLRTFAEQNALYAQGRTRKGPKVTNAKGGQSNHNYGLAVDLAFVINGEISWEDSLYSKLGKWAASAGLSWGGNWTSFKDLPHVELHGIPKWNVLFELHRQGGIAAVWKNFE